MAWPYFLCVVGAIAIVPFFERKTNREEKNLLFLVWKIAPFVPGCIYGLAMWPTSYQGIGIAFLNRFFKNGFTSSLPISKNDKAQTDMLIVIMFAIRM